MSKVPVSVVVIAKNEEKNIETCLKSVHGWADEIIVVDDESSDTTVQLAEKYADKVFHKKMNNEGEHRNWAYAQTKNKWVFSLDADETVTDELKVEIDQVLPTTDKFIFGIPRRNYVGDFWMKHGGQYPAQQLRLFLKGTFRYEEASVHPGVKCEGGREKVQQLTKDIVHKSYRDITHFLAKVNGQTTLEAQKWVSDNRKMPFGKAMWRTIDRFFRAWIGKKGYKDGLVGLISAIFSGLYQIVSYAKYKEMKKEL